MDTGFRLSVVIVISVVVSLAPMLRPLDDRSYAAEQAVVRVAAAGDTKFAFDEIIEAFRRQRAEIEVRATYGSSGNFYAQLSNQAPYDMFLSAGPSSRSRATSVCPTTGPFLARFRTNRMWPNR